MLNMFKYASVKMLHLNRKSLKKQILNMIIIFNI